MAVIQLNDNLTARTLHKMNAKVLQQIAAAVESDAAEEGKPLTAEAADMVAEQLLVGHEITRSLVSKLAGDDDALGDALVQVLDDIDQYLKPDEEEGTPTEVTER